MNLSFENKRVLVTGAGSGMGYCIAKAFVENCAEKVFALSKTQANLDKLVAEEPKITPVCVDLSDWAATRKAVEGIGPIDVLVNNAGITIIEGFLDIKPESIDKLFDVNFKSIVNVSQVVVAGMIERKQGGAIVNVSSQASKVCFWDHAIYCSTKAGVDAVTRCMAFELGQYNIRINAVNPTVVWTAMGKTVWEGTEKAKVMLNRTPLKRFAEIEDVVHSVLYLASDKAGMVTGTALPVEGGYLLG